MKEIAKRASEHLDNCALHTAIHYIFATGAGGILRRKNLVMESNRCLRVFGPFASSIACVRFG